MECPHFVASRQRFPGTCRRPPHSLPSLSPHSFPSPRGGYSSSRPNLQAEPSVRSPNSPAYLTCTTTQAHPQVPSRPPACGGTAAALGKTTSPHPGWRVVGRGGGSWAEGGPSLFKHPAWRPDAERVLEVAQELWEVQTARAAGPAGPDARLGVARPSRPRANELPPAGPAMSQRLDPSRNSSSVGETQPQNPTAFPVGFLPARGT